MLIKSVYNICFHFFSLIIYKILGNGFNNYLEIMNDWFLAFQVPIYKGVCFNVDFYTENKKTKTKTIQ